MSSKAVATISHIGICSSDLERSVRFYTSALGFEQLQAIDEIGAPYDTLLEMPGAVFSANFLKSGDVTIELVAYPGGNVSGAIERCPMNRRGFTHMTLLVDDVAATAERIVEFGGRIHPETRVDSPVGPLVFCTDPDGVRLELMHRPG